MEHDESKAREAAESVMHRAHAPYSKFRVGAAIALQDGTVFAGCNVESASYGLTLCAERSALSAVIAARGTLGPEEVTSVVIATEADAPTPPCGACRQWLAEFAPSASVLAVTAGGLEGRWSVAELLPEAFTGDQLP
ncbi:MAG: cytidine deaminase [Planctomycetota bacterium]|jgi:cytidine deaminase